MKKYRIFLLTRDECEKVNVIIPLKQFALFVLIRRDEPSIVYDILLSAMTVEEKDMLLKQGFVDACREINIYGNTLTNVLCIERINSYINNYLEE